MILASGCARLPKQSSASRARDRFLAAYAAAHGPERGVAAISVKRAGKGQGSARVRWAANQESLAVVGYVGPTRALDASLQGDELMLLVRHYDVGVSGKLRREEGLDGRLLRFLATPWDFSLPRVRGALEHAAIEPAEAGWRFQGGIEEGGRFTLELSERGEPRSLSLRAAGERGQEIRVRYGPERNYTAGRIPGWIEWSFSGSVVLLTIEDFAPVDASKIRYRPAIEPEWRMLALDEPDGSALVRWLLGIDEGGTAEP
jgi:hypothetical protein